MINYGSQLIDKKDIKSVEKTLKSNFLTQGPQIKKFENEIKKIIGAKYSCVVNSGTAALHLACLALGIKKNDYVITTPITFLASANAILYVGAKPIFIDINSRNYCIDLTLMEKKIKYFSKKKKIKAAIITDYAGQPCDWKKIKQMSTKYNFFTINDNCHSFGSKYYNDTEYALKYADIVTHSFHPVKIITTGEGGNIATNSKKIFQRVNLLRSHGVERNNSLKKKFGNWYYEMKELGYNYRMPDINAALGLSQIKKINKFLKRRKQIAEFYNKNLIKNNNITLPFVENFSDHSYHLYPVKINYENLKIKKKLFFKKLYEAGINLQVHYIPIHLQRYYKKKYKFKSGNYPVSENFYKKAVSLPIHCQLSNQQLDYIVRKINFYLK